MKTLEIGVEALQREKNVIGAERDELKAKLEASEKNSAILNEQVGYLNERNGTLSKKCVDLLDGSKEYKEKFVKWKIGEIFNYFKILGHWPMRKN
jgi:hypothetical protein